MRILIYFCILPLILAGYSAEKVHNRVTKKINNDWLFHRGDINGAESPEFNDSDWQEIDIPHDWSIADIPGTASPFDSTVENGVASGFTRGGTGWYRKYFSLPETAKNKQVFIRFEGVYKNTDVWLNGEHLGNNFYGYTPFLFNITDKVVFDKDNVLAVQVKNTSVTCRWYSGSGIYRHVWLTIVDPLHFANNGVFITTPNISETESEVKVVATINNQSDNNQDANFKLIIKDEKNNTVAEGDKNFSIQPKTTLDVNQLLTLSDPVLWDLNNPHLYKVEAKITVNGELKDAIIENFGIRKITFDPENGFQLNGKTINLKGGCIHHDNGPLGARAYDRAEERKVELLKEAGFNAIRFAHNPPSNVILNTCDRLGILAINESFDVWNTQHFDNDYASVFFKLWRSDMEAMVKRDRNHPSIIMWSIGNEIKNTETPEVAAICDSLGTFVRNLDPTRPVTAGVHKISDEKDEFLSHLDVSGYNYSRKRYVSDHERHPDRIMYGSESYAIQAYDYWQDVLKYPWVIGDFVWTAFDYIGEASIGWRGYPQNQDFYPWNLAYCGDIDVFGLQRPQSYYRQTLWNKNPIVKVFVEPPVPTFPLNPEKASWSIWDWPDVVESWNFEGYELKELKVTAYSNCEEVELFINGRSLGKKPNTNKNMFSWQVVYNAGELTAIAFKGGQKVDSFVLRTAEKPGEIILKADRENLKADGRDLCYIDIELVDEKGTINPKAENLINFTIEGSGKILAVGNSNPTSTESFHRPYRKAWQGKCQVIIQTLKQTGEIRLKAETDGLPAKTINLNVI